MKKRYRKFFVLAGILLLAFVVSVRGGYLALSPVANDVTVLWLVGALVSLFLSLFFLLIACDMREVHQNNLERNQNPQRA